MDEDQKKALEGGASFMYLFESCSHRSKVIEYNISLTSTYAEISRRGKENWKQSIKK